MIDRQYIFNHCLYEVKTALHPYARWRSLRVGALLLLSSLTVETKFGDAGGEAGGLNQSSSQLPRTEEEVDLDKNFLRNPDPNPDEDPTGTESRHTRSLRGSHSERSRVCGIL